MIKSNSPFLQLLVIFQFFFNFARKYVISFCEFEQNLAKFTTFFNLTSLQHIQYITVTIKSIFSVVTRRSSKA